jgi:hypothetical protein
MEEQEKQQDQSEDVEAHRLGRLNEEPGTPDEHGRRNRVEDGDDDVEAHIHKT